MSYDESSDDNSSDDVIPETNCKADYPTPHPFFENFTTEGQDQDKPCIHVLNDDCMYLLFEYMDVIEVMRVATVCRRWYNLCLGKMSLVSKIELNPTFSIFRLNRSLSQSNFITLLVLTRNNLTHLDVSHSSLRLDWASCRAISELCPNLQELDLSKMKIGNKIATCFSQFMPPKLKSLILNGCVSFKDKCLERILKNTKQLTQLNLSYNHKISGGCIPKHLGQNRMTHFIFTECYRLKPLVVQFVLSNFEESLQHLDLSFCCGKLFEISTHQMPILKELKVFKAKCLVTDIHPTGAHMLNFLRIMPNLQVLDLENNDSIGSDKVIATISRLCPKLKHLNISNCLPESAQSLSPLSSLELLEELYLNWLPKRLDHKDLIDSTLLNCSNLKFLALQSSHVDDESVFALISGSEKLQTLDLRSCILTLDGSFITLCQELDRQTPLKIFAQDTVMQEDEFPIIPAFLDINFGLPHFQDEYDEFFGGPYDEYDAFDEVDEDWGDVPDEDAYWGGAYVDEAGQFAGVHGLEYHEYQDFNEEGNHDPEEDGDWW